MNRRSASWPRIRRWHRHLRSFCQLQSVSGLHHLRGQDCSRRLRPTADSPWTPSWCCCLRTDLRWNCFDCCPSQTGVAAGDGCCLSSLWRVESSLDRADCCCCWLVRRSIVSHWSRILSWWPLRWPFWTWWRRSPGMVIVEDFFSGVCVYFTVDRASVTHH